MRKTDKKIDNALRQVLTHVCEILLKESEGFCWLTHRVNYNQFSSSLVVVCVFDTNSNVQKAETDAIRLLISKNLLRLGINIKNKQKQITFDSEENCNKENEGNWASRLN